ncbi:ABC transporter substrate-binding protein [Natronorubrum sp. FCH18a]|uniref:ABC transporter substrate-binding protein n=1 Tax=Natronorubrum sp. FCH18a TaxID=3447018 RepID=UPI003F515D57
MDVGIGAERLTELYVDRLNEEGGIMGEEIELHVGDTESSASTTNRLVNDYLQQGVDMLGGTISSEGAFGVIDRIAESDALFFVGGAAAPEIVQNYAADDYETYKGIFQMNTNSIDQAEAYADYAAFLSDTHGWNSYTMMYEDAAWTEAVEQIAPNRMEDEYGLTIDDNLRVDIDTTDWAPILSDVEDNGSDVLFKFHAAIPGVGLLSDWASNEYPFAMEGSSVASMSSRYWESTNGNCLYETTIGGSRTGEAINDESILEMYQSEYDSQPMRPMYLGLHFVDSLYAFKHAAEEVGSIDDSDAIAEEVTEMDESGPADRIRFYGRDSDLTNSRNTGRGAVTPQWQDDGEFVTVWPEAVASSEHLAPDWL